MKKLLLWYSLCLLGVTAFAQKKTQDVIFETSQKVVSNSISRGFYLIKIEGIEEFCKQNNVSRIKSFNRKTHIIHFNEDLTSLYRQKISVFKISDDWKLGNSLLNYNSDNFFLEDTISLSVHSTDLYEFKKNWSAFSPESDFKYEYGNVLIIEIPINKFKELLAHPLTTHIEKNIPAKVETPVVESDLSVNEINFVHRLYPELNGEGIVVSVKELLFDVTDIDFRNRFFLNGLEAETIDAHAALIGTAIGGAGNSSIKSIGVANATTLTSSSFLRILPDSDESFSNNNISVQNHSYGTTIENEYGNEAAAYDASTQTLPTVLHIFSSGNIGNQTSEVGPYAGIPNFANQTGNFKGAKNIITVGAVNREGVIDPRSSRGPAYDGRVKPELVSYAPGGTSDAAALVSGVSVLLQQAYQNTQSNVPSSSLVKAVLIAGSDDVGPTGIDFESGYGNLNARQSVEIMLQNQYFEGTITQSNSQQFTITIPPSAGIFKIALTWNDPPANPGDAIALINDIDMVLTDNSGNDWLPWVLNSTPDINALTLPAQRMEDHLNNVEFITLENPPPGDYTVTLTGTQVTAQQSFSIAYHYIANDTFEWTYPTAIDPLFGEQENIIRWNSTLGNGIGSLEYNINDQGWQTLNDQVDLNSGSFNWPVTIQGGTAQLRMTVGNEQFISERFAISPELLPRVLFNCDEEILLGWNQVENATAYNVRTLDERFMEIVQTVTDTTALIIPNNFPSPYFSVEPVFDGLRGVRGRTFNFELQGVNCYFINFFAFLADDAFVETVLNLSTSINVDEVRFEKSLNGISGTINTFNAPFNNLNLSFRDLDLESGTNTYTAVITLNDGTEIRTDAIEIFVPEDNTLIVFPNPVESGNEINIISAGAGQQYQIVNLSGQVMDEGDIAFINDRIRINLPLGIYILRLIKNNRTVETRKFIVD